MTEQVNITEWLANAKEDPKLAAQPVIIILGLFFIGYKALYAPKVVELERELRKNSRVERDIKQIQSAGDNIENIKLEIEDERESWRKARNLCYKKSEATQFMRRVREIAQITGINIRNVNPKSISPQKLGEITVEKFPVTFNFNGDLVKLGMFLRLLEKEEKISFITLPRLETNASGVFDMELGPTTILIPDELAED